MIIWEQLMVYRTPNLLVTRSWPLEMGELYGSYK